MCGLLGIEAVQVLFYEPDLAQKNRIYQVRCSIPLQIDDAIQLYFSLELYLVPCG